MEGRGTRAGERLNAVQSLLQHGYLLLFAFVLAEQAGLPVPAVPALLGVGALIGAGRMSMTLAFTAVLAASLPPDIIWYELGRRRGGRVLASLCRISLEPDSCVRSAENMFLRRGRGALLIAKFFPGLSTVAPPLAGMVGIARWQFLVLDIAAAILWAGTWMTLGYIFSDALELVAAWAGRLGNSLLVVIGGALAMYILFKFVQRRRFLHSLRVARITPEELKRRLDLGDETLAIVDTRAALEVDAEPFAVPGALWIPAEDISRRHAELPRGRELVLYCT